MQYREATGWEDMASSCAREGLVWTLERIWSQKRWSDLGTMSGKVGESLSWRCLKKNWARHPMSRWCVFGHRSSRWSQRSFPADSILWEPHSEKSRGMLRPLDEGFLVCTGWAMPCAFRNEACSAKSLARGKGRPGGCTDRSWAWGGPGWEQEQPRRGLAQQSEGQSAQPGDTLERGRAGGGRQKNQFPCSASLSKQAFKKSQEECQPSAPPKPLAPTLGQAVPRQKTEPFWSVSSGGNHLEKCKATFQVSIL